MRIGIIGGTGMAEAFGAALEGEPIELDTPWGRPSSPLVLAELEGVPLAFLSRHGKGHLINASYVPYRANVWALKRAGVTHLLATGAVGSLREALEPAQPVIPDQLIDRTVRRAASFFDELSVHVELSAPFCSRLRRCLLDSARELSLPAHPRGTYVCMEGPQLSTRAESEMHRQLGGDLIGMTAMPEARLAREAELCYALVALPTDYDCWRPRPDGEENGQTLKEIGENLALATARGLAILRAALPRVAAAAREPCACHSALGAALWFDRTALSPEQRDRFRLLLGRYLDA